MSNEVRFNIRLNIDGKEKVVTATTAVDNLRRVVNEAKGATGALQEQLINTNQIVEKWNNVSNAIGQLSSVLNDFTAESRSFGGAMAAANTMAGKSGDDFAKLKEQVAELSHEVPVARDELANGLYQVISNGVPEDNWIVFLIKSARASVGGIADLGETVKVTSTIIKNYGLDWDAAGSIQDKIQLTAKNGVTSFEQLAQALPRVTSQASTLGVSIEELMATFSTLTGVSGNTAEVSTQLAAIFTALIKPSSEAAEMAQLMGIQFDAAAIKAAGGMEQFLVSLDKSVKQYAASSGMLEQEIYGKLFGSAESLRALTPLTGKLAEKFREDVADMKNSAGTIDKAFDILSSTGAAKLQLINNKLGEYSDMLQSSIGNVLPYINVAAQMATGAAAAVSLSKSFNLLAVSSKLARTVIAMFSPVIEVCSATMRGATVSATTLKLAIRSLMISTGVGIAIVALTEAINYLMNSSDDAVKSVDNLSESEQKAKMAHQQTAQQIASVRSEMMQNIAALKNFKGSKEQEKAMVQQMNTKYGEAMGYYSTVSQWYQALTANSKAYCNQMINEITIRNLANQAADLQQQRYDYTHDKNGKVKKFDNRDKIGYVKGEGLQILPGTSQKAEADKVVTNLYRQEQNLKKRMEALVKQNQNISYKHTAGYSATPPTLNTSTGSTGNAGGSGNTNTGNTPVVTEDKKALEGSIDWYEEKINEKQKELNATANKAAARALNAEMEGLQRQLYMLKVDVGIEDVPKLDVKTFASNLTAQLNEEIEAERQKLLDKPLVINTEVEAKARDYDHISSLFNIDVSNFESVRTGLADINGISDSTAKGMAAAGASCEMLGSALQQLGGDSAAAKAGMMAAAIGQFVLSFAQAMSTCKTWIDWLAFGISGTAQLTSIISTISQFATGGIVGGNQTSGDKVLVRVNSGEMILNAAQQARLFAIANGAAVQGVSVNTAGLQGIGGGISATLGINGRLRGRDIVMAVANETRSNRRRSNIKI
jgi:TP901 family phage tail tape measure protein|nr:MAG TPA: minor tail protein [Bacteriophage sp.]